MQWIIPTLILGALAAVWMYKVAALEKLAIEQKKTITEQQTQIDDLKRELEEVTRKLEG